MQHLASKANDPVRVPFQIQITSREREVLALLAGGMSTKEIAYELGIAFKTVACHRTRIMNKLVCRNVADMTRAAIRMGLITP
jgi:DNA-binding NarL/FixJ family response regulator